MLIWFDLLYLNNEFLLHRPYAERRDLLEQTVDVIPHFVELSQRQLLNFTTADDLEAFRQHYAKLIAQREEGVIIKPLTSKYSPGRTGTWVKLKRDYIEGLGDTNRHQIHQRRYHRWFELSREI